MQQPLTTVAHVITGLQTGGAEVQLKRLVLASDPHSFQHIVISMTAAGPLASDLRAAGVRVYTLGMRPGIPSLAGLGQLVTLLRRSRPRILHCWLYHGCLLGLIAAGLARVPYVVWGLHSANEQLLGYSLLTRSVVRLCAMLSRLPDAIVAISEKGKVVHERWGYSGSRLIVIPNGTDCNHFTPDPTMRCSVRNELGIGEGSLLVGLIARHHPVKDHSTFLRAAGILASRHDDLHFLLAGEGIVSANADLQRMIRQNALEARVHLLGPRRDVPRLLAALDIKCLSSWSEACPNVIGEAMSCGVPCVVTDVGDAARIVGDTGVVVAPRDPKALAQAIAGLIEMGPAERAALGERARKRVLARFALQNTVRAYESLYKNLAADGQSQTSSLLLSRHPRPVPQEPKH